MPKNKIIVWMQTSLDGRTAGPGGAFDWPVVGDELHDHFVDDAAGRWPVLLWPPRLRPDGRVLADGG